MDTFGSEELIGKFSEKNLGCGSSGGTRGELGNDRSLVPETSTHLHQHIKKCAKLDQKQKNIEPKSISQLSDAFSP